MKTAKITNKILRTFTFNEFEKFLKELEENNIKCIAWEDDLITYIQIDEFVGAIDFGDNNLRLRCLDENETINLYNSFNN